MISHGADATSGTLISAVLALCLYPQAQATAQDEIDAVVGTLRSPSWEDLDAGRLPYTTALAKEILRWQTGMVLGGSAHAPTRTDIYQGYLIPKGTRIMCNVWAMHQNPREFPDPNSLKPERFLGTRKGGLAFTYPNASGHDAFGWGHARCSGQSLAEQGILSVLARLLWAFRIEPESGKCVRTVLIITYSLPAVGLAGGYLRQGVHIMLTALGFSCRAILCGCKFSRIIAAKKSDRRYSGHDSRRGRRGRKTLLNLRPRRLQHVYASTMARPK